MDSLDMIKYALIVLLILVLVLIFMRLYSSTESSLDKDSSTKKTGERSVQSEPSVKSDVQIKHAPGVSEETEEHESELETFGNENINKQESSEVLGYSNISSDILASVPVSENSPNVQYKTCDLNKVSPEQLLPSNNDTEFSKLNPSVGNNLNNKNFLEAGAHIGLDTVGQSLRNANYQLRADPPNPKQNVSPWMNSTIQPDPSRKSLA